MFERWRERLILSFDNRTWGIWAWILLTALVLTLGQARDLSRNVGQLCELTGDHPTFMQHPVTNREKIDAICDEKEPQEIDR